jgi:hypothetical protein
VNPDGLLVITLRLAAGSVDAFITLYALVRAFSFAGSNRYMRLCLATFGGVLTYGQYSLAAHPGDITPRTFVGWAGSALALVFWLMAVRADSNAHLRRKSP